MAYRAEKDLVHYISGTIAPSVQISGVEEVVAAFDELPRYIQLAGQARALQAAGDVLLEAVDSQVPIRLGIDAGDITVEGGDLKGAIRTELELDANYRGGVIEVNFGKLGYIANFVEYGHVMKSHSGKTLTGPKTPGGFVKANPFMRRGFDMSADRSIEAYTGSMRDTIIQWGEKHGVEVAA
jgi:hypothetical protein